MVEYADDFYEEGEEPKTPLWDVYNKFCKGSDPHIAPTHCVIEVPFKKEKRTCVNTACLNYNQGFTEGEKICPKCHQMLI